MANTFLEISSKHKTIYHVLCSTYNINKAKCYKICDSLGINPETRIDLLAQDAHVIFGLLELYVKFAAKSNYVVPASVATFNLMKQRQALQKLSTVRYLRLKNGLPVNGQNTHSNGRTAKKKYYFYDI